MEAVLDAAGGSNLLLASEASCAGQANRAKNGAPASLVPEASEGRVERAPHRAALAPANRSFPRANQLPLKDPVT